MRIFGNETNKQLAKERLLVEDYFKDKGLSGGTIATSDSRNNPLEDYMERHELYEDALKTEDGRRGAELGHRLTARMIVLSALVVPMVVVPFWLMWILSPANAKNYNERMQGALLAALASNALGLCWVVTRDLFPLGSKNSFNNQEESSAPSKNA